MAFINSKKMNKSILFFQDTIGISENQLKKFRQLMDTQGEKILLNYRVTQPVNQRQILDVSTSTKKFASDSECPEKMVRNSLKTLSFIVFFKMVLQTHKMLPRP